MNFPLISACPHIQTVLAGEHQIYDVLVTIHPGIHLKGGRRQKLSATPDLSGTVLPLCLIPNSA
ncbi:hypothetical protein, partial [Pseudomonas aeruginosa]|uniref:hypothetical protein n=1 Tax=Pseudomonas aeruginosa TaxID=287 RepID=UPI001C534242